MTRQRTNWEFNASAGSETYIRAGRTHNPKWKCKADIIRLQSLSKDGYVVDIHMTVDEAVVISAALMKVVAREMWNRDLDVRGKYEV